MIYLGYTISECRDDSPFFLMATCQGRPTIYADIMSKLKTAIEDAQNA